MDVKEVMLDIEAYVTEKVNEGESGMGFINTHIAAIRTHIENREAVKAELVEAREIMSDKPDWVMVKAKTRAAIAKAEVGYNDVDGFEYVQKP